MCITWKNELIFVGGDGEQTASRKAFESFKTNDRINVVNLEEKYERGWNSENTMREVFKKEELHQWLKNEGVTNLLTIAMGNSKSHCARYNLIYGEPDAQDATEEHEVQEPAQAEAGPFVAAGSKAEEKTWREEYPERGAPQSATKQGRAAPAGTPQPTETTPATHTNGAQPPPPSGPPPSFTEAPEDAPVDDEASEREDAPVKDEAKRGALVTLDGLTDEGYNGKTGTVQYFNVTSGRYHIALDTSIDGNTVAIKPVNVTFSRSWDITTTVKKVGKGAYTSLINAPFKFAYDFVRYGANKGNNTSASEDYKLTFTKTENGVTCKGTGAYWGCGFDSFSTSNLTDVVVDDENIRLCLQSKTNILLINVTPVSDRLIKISDLKENQDMAKEFVKMYESCQASFTSTQIDIAATLLVDTRRRLAQRPIHRLMEAIERSE